MSKWDRLEEVFRCGENWVTGHSNHENARYFYRMTSMRPANEHRAGGAFDEYYNDQLGATMPGAATRLWTNCVRRTKIWRHAESSLNPSFKRTPGKPSAGSLPPASSCERTFACWSGIFRMRRRGALRESRRRSRRSGSWSC